MTPPTLTIPQAMDLALRRHQSGQIREAEHYYRQILTQQPNHADAMHFLGLIAHQTGHSDIGLSLIRQSLTLNPNWPAGFSNLGNTLRDLWFLDAAIDAYRQALSLKPSFPEALSNLGSTYKAKGQLDEAITACRQAIAIDPLFAQAHYNLASCLLTRGNYAEGWAEYEWRTRMHDFFCPWQDVTQPRWDGTPLNGKTILLFIEQGLGDGFQSARYVPKVADLGGRIIIRCNQNQTGLFNNLPGVEQVILAGDPQPEFDVYAPMMSLPLILGQPWTIPSHVPYLKVDPSRVAAWGERLSAYTGLKVGLTWKGKPHPDPLRSCKLHDLAPLAKVPGIQFFSLQVEDPSKEMKSPPTGLNLVDLSPDLFDFVETGSCLLNLDLIITIDTAVAHLAGALACPTWTLLPVSADWRWMQDRDDSPWYPTMRLYRQTKHKDWAEVMERLATDLRQQATASATPSAEPKNI